MIVRVIARGQANGSADEYLCARARAGEREGAGTSNKSY